MSVTPHPNYGQCSVCTRQTTSSQKFIPFVFVGHHSLHVDREICTWFHATVSPVRLPGGRLCNFDQGFCVLQFLKQQAQRLRFDNQLNVSHWNLVMNTSHVLGEEHFGYTVLDHRLHMNNIPENMWKFLEIHAVVLENNERQYAPELISDGNISEFITASNSFHHAVPAPPSPESSLSRRRDTNYTTPRSPARSLFSIKYLFVGHDPHMIGSRLEKECTADIYKVYSLQHGLQNFASGFTVFDFLQQQEESLNMDNQINITHWNLVLRLPRVSADATNTYKICDHYLNMDSIPQNMLAHMEIHAVPVNTQKVLYASGLLDRDNVMAYFSGPPDVRHKWSNSIGNDAYHTARNGHGWFQDRRRDRIESSYPYMDFAFSDSNPNDATPFSVAQNPRQ